MIGEIRMFAGNFPPRNWAFCNGQLLSIAQNTALFSILGTTYGGNGVNNFGLPNLQGRVPIHWGQGPGLSSYVQGQIGGAESVTLLTSNLPAHSHLVNGIASGGNQASPAGNIPAIESTGTSMNYASGSPNAPMNPAMIGNTGSNFPVPIVQPYQTVSFIIALIGIFPSRN
jgi:microcystin-dependent protein